MSKKIILRIFALICTLIVIALVLPSFIDWNSYKEPLLGQINKQTNLVVTIDGDIKLSLLPSPHLSISQVSVRGAHGMQTKNAHESSVKLKQLSLAVDLMPLLGKKISIRSIELIEPVIFIDNKNTKNTHITAETAQKYDAHEKNEKTQRDNQKAGQDNALSLDISNVSVVDGIVIINDSAAKKRTDIKSINLDGAFSLKTGFDMKARANVDGLQVNGTIKGGAFVDVLPSTLDVNCTLTQDKGMKGELTLSAVQKNGVFTISSFKAKVDDINASGKGMYTIDKSTGSVALTVTSKIMNASGTVGVDLSHDKPMFKADLVIPKLEDKAWAKSGEAKAASDTNAQGTAPHAAMERWSKDSIDLSGLQSVNADVTLAIDTLHVSDIAASNVNLHINVNNGLATIKQLTANACDGSAAVTGTLDSKTGQLVANVKLATMNMVKLPGVKGSALKAGMLSITAAITTKATSMHAIINQLNGTANLSVNKGILEGVDIKQFMIDLKTTKDISGLSKLKASFDRKADMAFNHVRGDVKLANGVADTRNFEIDMNEGAITSVGALDLPNWKLALTSHLTVRDAKNIPNLAVNISGAIDQPNFALDMNQLQKALIQLATNQLADRAKDTVKKKVTEQIAGKLGGQVAEQMAPEVSKAIGKLLPGLFG